MRSVAFVNAVVCVGVSAAGRRGSGFGSRNAIYEIEVRSCGFRHHIADSFCSFTFHTFPACGFRVAGFGGTDFFLPFPLHFVKFVLLFALSGSGKWRWWRRVDKESIWYCIWRDTFDLWLWKRNEVGDEFMRIAAVVNRIGGIIIAELSAVTSWGHWVTTRSCSQSTRLRLVVWSSMER